MYALGIRHHIPSSTRKPAKKRQQPTTSSSSPFMDAPTIGIPHHIQQPAEKRQQPFQPPQTATISPSILRNSPFQIQDSQIKLPRDAEPSLYAPTIGIPSSTGQTATTFPSMLQNHPSQIQESQIMVPWDSEQPSAWMYAPTIGIPSSTRQPAKNAIFQNSASQIMDSEQPSALYAPTIGIHHHIPSTPRASFFSLHQSHSHLNSYYSSPYIANRGTTPSTLRPSQFPAGQSGFQGHGMVRVSSSPQSPNPESFQRPTISIDKARGKRRIQESVNEIYPSAKVDPKCKDVVLRSTNEFLKTVIGIGCLLAKHRKSRAIEKKDIRLALEIKWNIKHPSEKGRALEEAAMQACQGQGVNQNENENADVESNLASDHQSSVGESLPEKEAAS